MMRTATLALPAAFLAVALLVQSQLPSAHALAEASRQREKHEFQHMSTAELRAFISARNAECRGCIEKEHFVDKAYQVQGLPVQQQKQRPAPDIDVDAMMKAFEEEQAKKQKMREILRKNGVELGDEHGDADPQAKILEQLRKMKKSKIKHQEL
eukprot:m.62865 g.62865  ORF g.62865 m.62865 type:complete len:154 (+) comp13418_c0_seq1:466-927(+)